MPRQAPPTELTRPIEGRMLAGVATGLAHRFNLPVLLIRVIFVILTFAGGLGVALYATGWFLIRSDDETETPAVRLFSGATSLRSWVGLGLVFLAVLVFLTNFNFVKGGYIWAIGLLVVGVLLYTGNLPRLSGGSGSEKGTRPDTQPEATTPGLIAANITDGGGVPPHVVPTPNSPQPAKTPKERSILGRVTIGVALVGLGFLALLDNLPGVPVYAEPRHYLALAVTILGLGLIVGAFAGRARWLILVGLIMIPSLLFSPVFEWGWSNSAMNRTEVVTSFADLDAYSLDVGNLVIDLTDLPWNGQNIELVASVNAGNLEVILPEGIAITGTASVDVGRVSAPGRESSGLGNPTINFDTAGYNGSVFLDLTVDVGNIDVRVRSVSTAN